MCLPFIAGTYQRQQGPQLLLDATLHAQQSLGGQLGCPSYPPGIKRGNGQLIKIAYLNMCFPEQNPSIRAFLLPRLTT